MTSIVSLRAEYIPIPLKHPFVISIRRAVNANVVRWHMGLSDGSEVLGECVPVQYVTGETVETAIGLAGEFESLLHGALVEDLYASIELLALRRPHDVAARAGVEICLYNAFSKEFNIPLIKLFGGGKRDLMTDVTISRVDDAPEIALEAVRQGFRTLKLKVGTGSIEEEVEHVKRIRDAVPDITFRIDANQAYDARDALRLIEMLLKAEVKIELLEQPVSKDAIDQLDLLSRESPIPIIADEACKSSVDAYRLFSETHVHGVNVKLMKSGIADALRIVAIAKAAGKKLMIGCMLESEIGMAASIAFAIGTQAFDYIDLDGHLLLDLPAPPTLFRAEGPMIGAGMKDEG